MKLPSRVLPLMLLIALSCAWLSAEPPQRIVSMTPSVTETLFALGLGDKVVGVTDFCKYPPEASSKTRIGGLQNPDVERILALRPDLVVTLPNEPVAKKLRSRGLTVLEVPSDSIQEVLQSFLAIGRATGTEEKAKELAAALQAKLESARKAVEKLPRPRVLFVVGTDPIFAAGKGSFLDDLIKAAGGQNVLADSKVIFPQLGTEAVISLAPEVIIDSTKVSTPTDEEVKAQQEKWSRWPAIPAVKNGAVFVLRDNRDIVPGPRLPQVIDDLLGMIHPELKQEQGRGVEESNVK